jgi:enoyl-CoA hydratase/carnithine racemase
MKEQGMDDLKQADMLSLRNVTAIANGPKGELRLTRSHRANACSGELIRDVIAAADWFDQRDSVKAITMHGVGKAFCAGFDLQDFLTLTPEEVRDVVELGRQMVQRVTRMKAVMVAAIHGACVGGGMVLAAACDFRYAARDTRFFLPEVDLGIPLAWGGMPWLVREVGPVVAMEVTLLCDRIPAERLLSAGFLNDVVDSGEVLERAMTTTERLSRKSSFVLRATKEQVIAAKNDLASTPYSFNDANLLYMALMDPEGTRLRNDYIDAFRGRKA